MLFRSSMHVYAVALVVLIAFASLSASATAILPRRGAIINTTAPDSGEPLDVWTVASPRPAGQPHQATREEVIARAALRAQQPAKRQTSPTNICARPDTGTTPYAVLTNAFFYTNYQIGADITESQQACYAACEANTGERLSDS